MPTTYYSMLYLAHLHYMFRHVGQVLFLYLHTASSPYVGKIKNKVLLLSFSFLYFLRKVVLLTFPTKTF